MNRIFSAQGEGWPEFPRKAFARLDQTEPVNPRESDEAVFAFDAVDANWSGFGAGGAFDLKRVPTVQSMLSQFWTEMFKSKPSPNPFDPMRRGAARTAWMFTAFASPIPT